MMQLCRPFQTSFLFLIFLFLYADPLHLLPLPAIHSTLRIQLGLSDALAALSAEDLAEHGHFLDADPELP